MLSFVIAIAVFTFQDDSIQQGIVAVPAAIVLFLLVCEVKVHWKASTGKRGTLLQRVKIRCKLLLHIQLNNYESFLNAEL